MKWGIFNIKGTIIKVHKHSLYEAHYCHGNWQILQLGIADISVRSIWNICCIYVLVVGQHPRILTMADYHQTMFYRIFYHCFHSKYFILCFRYVLCTVCYVLNHSITATQKYFT